jgi:hypothetical protein
MKSPTEIKKHTPDSKTQRAIERIRAVLSEGDFAIGQAGLGADTELMSDVKKLEEQPLHLANKSIEGHAAALAHFFSFFVKKIGLNDFVFSGLSRISGSKVSLRIILKKESWNYETRALFYQMIEQITETRYFSGLSVDFLILKEGDPDLPPAFQKLPI